MKSSEYLKELRTQSAAQLQEQLVAAKKELFNLRFQNATNQLDNTGRIKEVRKNIAKPFVMGQSKQGRLAHFGR